MFVFEKSRHILVFLDVQNNLRRQPAKRNINIPWKFTEISYFLNRAGMKQMSLLYFVPRPQADKNFYLKI